MSKDLHVPNPPRFRISGVRGGITTLQMAEMLDLSLRGALVEHQDMLHLGSPCFLQLETDGKLLTLRCRVVHSRVSRGNPKAAVFYQTGVEFLNLTPGAEEALRVLIRSYRAHHGRDGGGP